MKREVTALCDPLRARFLQGYFRTGSGQYGEGDRFLGLTVPQQRAIARAFRQLPLEESEKLLASTTHEHRLIALLILADQHERGDETLKAEFHRFYVEHLAGVNNRNLVDTSAYMRIERLDPLDRKKWLSGPQ